MTKYKLVIFGLITGLFIGAPYPLIAQSLSAPELQQRVAVTLSPRSGTFIEGSIFEVPVVIDTRGESVNSIEIRITFDHNKLSVVQPSGGVSIVGLWVEPPRYDNARGTVSYVGVVPGGIRTDSGLIGAITFKALSSGRAVIAVREDSSVFINDGLGTSAVVEAGRAEYTILPKPPEGVRIYSETHPSQNQWYNNPNPSLSWERDAGVDGFSYVIDNKSSTIPSNTLSSNETSVSFESLQDGLHYFHIKARKNGAWGTTGHYLLRIDTNPPAEFKPEINYLVSGLALVERTLVSFFTTDNLSGVDYYEVGVIDKSQPVTESPLFVRAESPFQVPLIKDTELRVIVRAVDKAGNMRDVSVDVRKPILVFDIIKDNLLVAILVVVVILHFLVGHHVVQKIVRSRRRRAEEESQGTVADTHTIGQDEGHQ